LLELPGLDSNQDKENQNPFWPFRHGPPMSAMSGFSEVLQGGRPLPSVAVRPIGYRLATLNGYAGAWSQEFDFTRTNTCGQPERVVLMHHKAAITEVYAERDLDRARRGMAELG
jgi:hypothetical protein